VLEIEQKEFLMVISHQQQINIIIVCLILFSLAIYAVLLATGSLPAGLKELHSMILGNVYKFC
jgi:hypothetical protein